MQVLYKHKKRFTKKIPALYKFLDNNESGTITLNEFFEIIEVMEKNPEFAVPLFGDLKIWNIIRKKFFNNILKIKKIVKHIVFEIFITLILISNCICLIIALTIKNESTINTLFIFDEIFLYFYIAEAVLKIIGLGFEKYFEDGWNRFDFIMVIMSLTSDFF